MFRLAIVIPLLLLTACFSSEEPLIMPADASWPFKDGQIVTAYGNCAVVKEDTKECGGRREGYVRDDKQGRFEVTDSGYLLKDVPPKADASSDDEYILFKDVGEGEHVMQLSMGKKKKFLLYQLIKLSGDTAYLYHFMCEKGDEAFVAEGLLTSVSEDAKVCEADDTAKLATIFRRKIASGAQPTMKLELEP